MLSLADVFFTPNFGPTAPYCVINKRDSLDEVEYGLGVERGWLLTLLSREHEDSELWENMNEDVAHHIQYSKMALLPERHVLDEIGKLLKYNLWGSVSLFSSAFFLMQMGQVLPFTEYIYTLLPPVFPPDARSLHIKGTDASPIDIHDPQAIRSRLHPCLLLHRTMRFAARLIPFPETLNVVNEGMFRDLVNASRDGYGLVQKSWLGDKWKYCMRPTVYHYRDVLPTRTRGDDDV